MAISQNFPNTPPSLFLDFAKSKKLDSRITFTRGSTGTCVDDHGLIRTAGINEPRFDHDPNTLKSLGLLIEESRTNSLIWSEDFNNPNWIAVNATLQSNATTAPDGTTNADKIIDNTSNSNHYYTQLISGLVDNTVYTFSVYLKSAGRQIAPLIIRTKNNAFPVAYFDLINGTIGDVSGGMTASIQNAGNGWYRCNISQNISSGATTPQVLILTSTANGIQTYQGDGTSGIFVWGAQLEVGSFPTSYIPTGASQVTRSADNASITETNFSSWYNSNAGSIFTQARGLTGTTFGCIVTLSGSTYQTGNGFLLRQSGSSIDRGGNSSSSSVEIASSTQFFKAACSFSGTTSDLSANGRLGDTLTTLDYTGSGTNTLNIGRLQPSGGQLYNGTISQIFYYPRRLSNTYLQELTR